MRLLAIINNIEFYHLIGILQGMFLITNQSNFFLVLKDSGVSLWGQISRLPEQLLALRLDCSTAALTTHQKVLPI